MKAGRILAISPHPIRPDACLTLLIHPFKQTVNPTLAREDFAAKLPAAFPNPFVEQVPPIARIAAREFQEWAVDQPWYSQLHMPNGGKMFGVLVVLSGKDLGYLAAFSGQLGGQWEQPGLVPPVFSGTQYQSDLTDGESKLATLSAAIDAARTTLRESGLENTLIKQEAIFKAELIEIKERHKVRKNLRHEQRAMQLQETATDNTTFLANLSRESQQDRQALKTARDRCTREIERLQQQVDARLKTISDLERQRAKFSRELQQSLFGHYVFVDSRDQKIPMLDLFKRYAKDSQDRIDTGNHQLCGADSSASELPLPPGGSGDCAAPKLFQYAGKKQLKPLALAEFWLGDPGRSQIREYGRFYPPCRSKCAVILPALIPTSLSGAGQKIVTVPPVKSGHLKLEVIHEEEGFLIVEKPYGLLSVPGKFEKDCVYNRIRRDFKQLAGPLIVHRLDFDTSGLMIIAKTAAWHKALQKLFLQRRVAKEYIAIVEGDIGTCAEKNIEVSLPIRVDLDDRPRQQVCQTHGKPSLTRFSVIGQAGENTRVRAYPVTGRTHQIRIHAAHRDGLAAPVLGDPLYGSLDKADGLRMFLHAESLQFEHPEHGKMVRFIAPAPF